MTWLKEILLSPSIIQTIILISVVATVGLQLGKLKLFNISLGITFVFFTGILVGHFDLDLDKHLLNFAQSFGLVIFIYALGLQVGPGFFSSLKKGGVRVNMLALAVIVIGTGLVFLFHWITPVSIPEMMGLLSGAVTNTPALGAAQQVLRDINTTDSPQVTDMALACAVTYPMGVVGVILAIAFMRSLLPPEKTCQTKEKKDSNTYVGEFLVVNPAINDKTIKEIMQLTTKKFVISRLWREGKVTIPTSETKLQLNDHLLVISIKSDVENIKLLFGDQENIDWNKEGIDWNRIDNSHLISRPIIVTRKKVNGVKLETLRLRNIYGINITRVNRAGIYLLASPDLALQLGDKLTIVGEAAAIDNVAKILGDKVKELRDPNLIVIFLGIALGLLLGSIPIPFPGMNIPVRLGIAGGPIVVGILMGAYGPKFRITTYTTQSANLMMRQFGLVIYLACLGIASGGQFFETILQPKGLLWLGIGVILTILPVIMVGLFAMKLLKLDFDKCVGMICGSMANPIALNYVNTTIDSDSPSVNYATVYPLSMFMRIIIAQMVIMFFA